MMTALSHIRNIYYRGMLDTCNYTCSYCPFGRKSASFSAQAADSLAWERFLRRIEQWEGAAPLRLFIVPYGEAMVHDYYREGILRLSRLPHVTGVSCQTNLSFAAEGFIQRMKETDTAPSKLKFWASFHPEMTGVEKFTQKVRRLMHEGIEVSVGAVGHPGNREVIGQLRVCLDRRIYLFINAMQGLRTPLTSEERACFAAIDNLFEQDRRRAKARPSVCLGGRQTLFVEGRQGDVYACPRSGACIGNLYDAAFESALPVSGAPVASPLCRRSVCDCYIAYSHLPDTPLHRMMGSGVLWRIPEKRTIQAAFFDVDGTLTDARGNVPDSYVVALQLLSRQLPLYLATSLPLPDARRRLGAAFQLFSGGVFADGAHILCGGRDEYSVMAQLPYVDKQHCKMKLYSCPGGIYKCAVVASSMEVASRLKDTLASAGYHLYHEKRLLTVVDGRADKRSGLERICEQTHISPLHVLAVGNTMHDYPMLAAAGFSCAVLGADEALKRLSDFVLNPDSLPAFFSS